MSEPQYPQWQCRTHGTFDAYTVVGCPECVRELREDRDRAYRNLAGMEMRVATLLDRLNAAELQAEALAMLKRQANERITDLEARLREQTADEAAAGVVRPTCAGCGQPREHPFHTPEGRAHALFETHEFKER